MSNEESRKQYDSWGHTAYHRYVGRANRYTRQEDEDYSRENGHCGACQTKKDAEDAPPPHSIRAAVKMSYQELFTGAVKSVEVPLHAPCSSCNGGQDTAPEKYRLEPGTRDGARIRLAGQGLWMPPKIGNRGDLYVTLQVEVPRKLNEKQRAALQAFWNTMQEESAL